MPIVYEAFQAAELAPAGASGALLSVESLVGGLKSILPAGVMMPFMIWLQGQGGFAEGMVNGINAAGTLYAMLVPGWGTALAAVGTIAQVMNVYNDQRKRIESNNWGDEVSDGRYGWVEDGGVWYPAVLRNRLKGEGMFDDSNAVTLIYGRSQDFYLKADHAGKVHAHFTHQKQRTFRMNDKEYSSVGYEDANENDLSIIHISEPTRPY